MKCWLCERGTNLDDGSLSPGEIKENFFGDPECVDCESRIAFTAVLLDKPPAVLEFVGKLGNAGVDGIKSVGIVFDDPNEDA